ncbi:MAG: anthranilate phosphoribosyltransferase [Alphaproteobacteria bacterium GM7ARS4]|nr:anthranilate phosphoribosyltransferase [Alphaproteobacteria bacterium GM7ARS4]
MGATEKKTFSFYWQMLASGRGMGRAFFEDAFSCMMEGGADPVQLGAFLVALRERGEEEEQLVAAAQSLRRHCVPVSVPSGAMDNCGTGGDGCDTLNVSTASAFVMASCGVVMAKHGNRAQSSRCGSADVLEALGLRLTDKADVLQTMLTSLGFAFLYAPHHHPSMRHVAPIRRSLAVRTIFNLVGPLANPCRVETQLVGVFDASWCMPMARSLRALGVKRGWVVHGEDGQDELSIQGKTHVVAFDGASLETLSITPHDVGLGVSSLEAMKGGDASYNAENILSVLRDEESAFRDAVLLNAGCGLFVAGKAETPTQGVEQARQALASGKSQALLNQVIGASKQG